MRVQTTTLIVFFFLISVCVGVGFASSAGAGEGKESQIQTNAALSIQQAGSNETTMWTNETIVAEGLRSSDHIDISDADRNGNHHVVYTKQDEIYHVVIATNGTIKQSSQVTVATNDVSALGVDTEPDGRTHILYRVQVDASTVAIRHLAVTSNGTVDVRQRVREAGENLNLNDVVVGPRGRVFVALNSEFRAQELWSVNGDQPGSRAVTEAVSRSAALTTSDDTVYFAYYFETTDKESIRVERYDVSEASIDHIDTVDLAIPFNVDVTRIFDMGIHPDGIVLVSYMDNRQNGRDTLVSAFNTNTGDRVNQLFERTSEVIKYEFTVDYLRRTFVVGNTEHRVYDETLSNERPGPGVGGEVARNGHGLPSVLSVSPAGEVLYRPMLVQSLDQLSAPITQYGSIDEALISRIQTLENQSQEPSQIVINLTVSSADGAESFQVGGNALLDADVSGIDLSALTVEYRDDQYSLNESGQTTIPLEDSGTYRLTVTYQNTSKSTTISVSESATPTRPPETETTDQASPGSEEGTTEQLSSTQSNGQPGFGFILGVVALLCVFITSYWRDTIK